MDEHHEELRKRMANNSKITQTNGNQIAQACSLATDLTLKIFDSVLRDTPMNRDKITGLNDLLWKDIAENPEQVSVVALNKNILILAVFCVQNEVQSKASSSAVKILSEPVEDGLETPNASSRALKREEHDLYAPKGPEDLRERMVNNFNMIVRQPNRRDISAAIHLATELTINIFDYAHSEIPVDVTKMSELESILKADNIAKNFEQTAIVTLIKNVLLLSESMPKPNFDDDFLKILYVSVAESTLKRGANDQETRDVRDAKRAKVKEEVPKTEEVEQPTAPMVIGDHQALNSVEKAEVDEKPTVEDAQLNQNKTPVEKQTDSAEMRSDKIVVGNENRSDGEPPRTEVRSVDNLKMDDESMQPDGTSVRENFYEQHPTMIAEQSTADMDFDGCEGLHLIEKADDDATVTTVDDSQLNQNKTTVEKQPDSDKVGGSKRSEKIVIENVDEDNSSVVSFGLDQLSDSPVQADSSPKNDSASAQSVGTSVKEQFYEKLPTQFMRAFGVTMRVIPCPHCMVPCCTGALNHHVYKMHRSSRQNLFGCPTCKWWHFGVQSAIDHYKEHLDKDADFPGRMAVRTVEEAREKKEGDHVRDSHTTDDYIEEVMMAFGLDANEVSCPYCGESCWIQNLQMHVYSQHAKDKYDLFGCEQCDEWYKNVYSAVRHNNANEDCGPMIMRKLEDAVELEKMEMEKEQQERTTGNSTSVSGDTPKRTQKSGENGNKNADENEKAVESIICDFGSYSSSSSGEGEEEDVEKENVEDKTRATSSETESK